MSTDRFLNRHLGPRDADVAQMLGELGVASIEALLDEVIPQTIRLDRELTLPEALTERQALSRLAELAADNEVWRSYIGMGYHDCLTPSVVLRNVLENPGWYTAYTPYQAEIAQGRLEALLIFQTMVQDLTGMEISNSSLLDEATAAAEAMTMAHRISRGKRGSRFFAAADCHPQVLSVVKTRAAPLDIEVIIGDPADFSFEESPVFGALLQYPATDGRIFSHAAFCEQAHAAGALVTVAADLLSLTLLQSPGEFGADIVIGNSQRLGVPLGYGGPHAAFLATREAYKRQVPGRIIGVSIDADGEPALRMALQTREQHIRRQKATSNICTAQVLLAVTAAMYGVWHGPDGLTEIARRTHDYTRRLAAAAKAAGISVSEQPYFDTLRLDTGDQTDAIVARAAAQRINLRRLNAHTLTISLNETVTETDLADLAAVLGGALPDAPGAAVITGEHVRKSAFMTHPFFHMYRSETEMMRYLHRLETRDLALNTSMIPLGSCTMKLNAATEMIPVTWRGFGGIHPFAPTSQAQGYQQLFTDLESWLAEITGFDAISLQPNAGSQGEYAGLLSIRGYHHARGDHHRDVCLIPTSAHGTNPASAVMAGMTVVAICCDEQGNIDLDDLRAKAAKHADKLAALMVTYPSTHGVFEESIREICDAVHEHGGQVYMDGANMNAMVGLCRPGDFGADVCHLNLHKTMSIPHGGGGPGMGPIGVKAHLAPFLPGDPVDPDPDGVGPVSAANWGSPSILPISWSYLAMLGRDGVRIASEIAILSANYVAHRLKEHFPVLYTGPHGRVAHECILDLRPLKEFASVDDVAKRLIDYGFHAPTMSWPVTGTLMVEPTESESLAELDRFCEAMISIRDEIRAIEEGRADPIDNVLHHAPHTAASVCSDSWDHPYSRMEAAFPARGGLSQKFWPVVRRIDNVYGDRNLACSCQAWMPAEDLS
ncbi:MAG: glycine dehydrogenase [Myxococcota bacterium]|jgi:glycine dehydrogenase